MNNILIRPRGGLWIYEQYASVAKSTYHRGSLRGTKEKIESSSDEVERAITFMCIIITKDIYMYNIYNIVQKGSITYAIRSKIMYSMCIPFSYRFVWPQVVIKTVLYNYFRDYFIYVAQ